MRTMSSSSDAGSAKRPPLRHRSGPLGWLTENSLDGMARRRAALGYLFILPTVLGILIFFAGPVLVSLGLSFFKWNIFQPAQYVSLQNYDRVLNDDVVVASFRNTFRFGVIAVSLQLTLGLMLALAVERKMNKWLRYYFRSAYFLPLLTSAASISIVMSYMFHREFGPINYYLTQLGLPRISWLNSSRWSLIAVVIVYVWQRVGFSFIVFIGGLNNIPREVLDAADVDGATGWRRLWHVILPLLSPTILFAGVIGFINALQVFDQPFVLTGGGPGDSSRTAVMAIYQAAFRNLEFGYGSTIAVLLFVAILLVTAFQFWVSGRYVFYQ